MIATLTFVLLLGALPQQPSSQPVLTPQQQENLKKMQALVDAQEQAIKERQLAEAAAKAAAAQTARKAEAAAKQDAPKKATAVKKKTPRKGTQKAPVRPASALSSPQLLHMRPGAEPPGDRELDKFPYDPRTVCGENWTSCFGVKPLPAPVSGWNYYVAKVKDGKVIEPAHWAWETIPAGTPMAYKDGIIRYKVDCRNRFIPWIEPKPAAAPSGATYNYYDQRVTNNVINEAPAEKPAAENPRFEAPPTEPETGNGSRFGLTVSSSLGVWKTSPVSGTIESATDWLYCLKGRNLSAGVTYGDTARSYWMASFAYQSIENGSYTSHRRDDGTLVTAIAQDVSVVGAEVGRTQRFLSRYRVSPIVALRAGVGHVSGQTQICLNNVLQPGTAGAEELYRSRWQLIGGVDAGVAIDINSRLTLNVMPVGIELPGVYYAGKVSLAVRLGK